MNVPVPQSFVLISLFLFACAPQGEVIEEKDHPAFERGKSLLKVGKSQDALDEFLAVTRRITECPQSHLECGRLLLSLMPVKTLLLPSIIFGGIFYWSPIPGNHPKWSSLLSPQSVRFSANYPANPTAITLIL